MKTLKETTATTIELPALHVDSVMSFKRKLETLVTPFSVIAASKKRMDRHNAECIKAAEESDRELTVVIHGILTNYYTGVFWFTKRLKQSGINTISLGFDYHQDLRSASLEIKKQINEILSNSNIKQINVVGISMGGVVARYYIEKLGGKNVVSRLVTVFSPLACSAPKQLSVADTMHLLVSNKTVAEKSTRYYKYIERSFSIPQLALYGTRDLVIGNRAFPVTLNKNVTLVPIHGGHTFVSFNVTAMELTEKYLTSNPSSH